MNKTQYEIWKEQHKWERWRWEFMRRNPEFQSDYKKVQNLRKKSKYKPDHKIVKGNVTEYPYVYTPEAAKEREYCAKHDISLPFFPDPNKSFDELTGGEPKFDEARGTYVFSAEQAHGHFYATRINPRAVKFYHRPGIENWVQVEINFNNVNSIDALKDHVSNLIQNHSEKLEKRKRLNHADYKLLLEAGDMSKNGLKHQEIAKKLFPRDFNINNEDANIESKIRTVGYYVKRYEELINGDYKKLTFP